MFLYVHIPFCASRCLYCDFYVTLEKYGGQAAYVEALVREIDARFRDLPKEPPPVLETLYIGGGTPSLLTAAQYQTIFDALRDRVAFSPDIEITLEANPGAMRDAPRAYRDIGVNRLSIGIQSFDDGELKKLSRAHTGEQARAFVAEMRAAGFDNISVDLMYGIPTQTADSWRRTIDATLALGVEHVSFYGLKVEDDTPLKRLVELGAYPLPDEDETVAMYFEGLERFEAAGLRRYEFSNLARPGFESRHNLNYWRNGDYYALGASAHGYVNGVRYENVRDLQAYLENPLAGTATPCPPRERLENAVIFGLRTREGIHLPALEAEYGIDFNERYGRVLNKYAPEGLFEREGDYLRLTPKAIPVSNALLAEFIDLD